MVVATILVVIIIIGSCFLNFEVATVLAIIIGFSYFVYLYFVIFIIAIIIGTVLLFTFFAALILNISLFLIFYILQGVDRTRVHQCHSAPKMLNQDQI